MKFIEPSETEIVGKWVLVEGHIVADEACQRIAELTEGLLLELGHDPSGWDALYRDPKDGRHWELTYPQSEMQGGGPPQLRCLSADEAMNKYGNITL